MITAPTPLAEPERRLWDAVDSLRANAQLKSSEYSVPVLGLIFLRYADAKFAGARERLQAQGGRRAVGKETQRAAQLGGGSGLLCRIYFPLYGATRTKNWLRLNS